MEHIVSFGISFDDETIKKHIQERAYQDVRDQLVSQAMSQLRSGRPSYRDDDMWKRMAANALTSWIDQHKDDVIEAAANVLADRFSRTKAFKQRMNEAIDSVDERSNDEEA